MGAQVSNFQTPRSLWLTAADPLSLWQIRQPKCSTELPEHLLEWWQRGHLVRKTRAPQRLQSRFFPKDRFLDSFRLLIAEREFPGDRRHQSREIHSFAGDKIPEVVKIAWLVPGAIRQSHDFLARGFCKRIDLHDSTSRQVGKLLVGLNHWPGFQRKDQLFANRDIHLYAAARRQRSDVPQIKCVAVGVRVAVLAVERELNPGGLAHARIHRLQPKAQILKGRWLQQREIKVFRKTVVAEVAALERRASFECEFASEIAFRQRTEKPGKTVIPFEDASPGYGGRPLWRADLPTEKCFVVESIRCSGLLRVLRAPR